MEMLIITLFIFMEILPVLVEYIMLVLWLGLLGVQVKVM